MIEINNIKNITMKRINYKVIRHIALSIAMLCIISQTYAQKRPKKQTAVNNEITKAEIKLSARNYGDSIVLRWAIDKSSAWRFLNEHGYIIERLTLDADNKVTEDFRKLSTTPIKPWTYAEWGERINKNDDYAVIAAQTLYGETFDVSQTATSKAEQLDNMADEARMRHAFAMLSADISTQAADGLGLRFVDKDIKGGDKFIYRIYSIHPKTSFTTDTAIFIIGSKDIYNVYPPLPPKAVEGEHQIVLNWEKEYKFSAYLVQRSGDNGKTYIDLTRKPYLQISRKKEDFNKFTYSDSIPKNYKPYLYRIAGITSFGDVSPWSMPIKTIGRDRTAPEKPRIIKSHVINDDNDVKISWEIDKVASDMKGFFVGRGTNVTGPFEPLHKKALPNNTREYIDKDAVVGSTNYYVVASVDTAKNISQSMPGYVVMGDNEPPAKPLGMHGEIDTNGVVRLWWPKGKEPDLNGYRVYYSNHKNGEYHALTGTFQDTTFTDTINLKTLDELIYYRIVAVDMNLNNSKYSDVLELQKPDIINPVAPVFKKYNVTETDVYISWIPSSSKDVVKQKMYKREPGAQWQEYQEFDKGVKEFTDKEVSKEKIYEYSLTAIDDAGLSSENSKPLTIRIYNSGMQTEVRDFNVKLAGDNKSVELAWEYEESSECNFLIYRAYNGAGLQMHATTKEGSKEYVDKNVGLPGTYTYAIKVVNKNGNKSLLSESKKVEVKK